MNTDNIVITEVTDNNGGFQIPEVNPNPAPKTEPIVAEVMKSKNFISGFMEYIKSHRFINRCNEVSKKTGVGPKQVARNFFEHILGTIGDVLGIVIDIGQDIITTTLDLLGSILKGAASVICNVARGLVRVVTLNKTVTA